MPALAWLDRWLYRRPFVGGSARRYARAERPAFADLDVRLVERWHRDLATATRVIDVGAGPGTVGRAVAARWPGLQVVDVEPSPTFPRRGPRLRARAEALPIADAAVDVAVSVSAIRHVRDRGAALRELRRVVRPGGAAWVVELDPEAPADRVARHAAALGAAWLRWAFAPLVVATAPPVAAIVALARAAGWTDIAVSRDDLQPVYLVRLA